MKKTIAERIAAAEERKAQLVARLAAMKGKQKAVDRKRDTKRKIVVGAAMLVEMERDPKFADYVRKILRKAVTRPQDQEAITDLLSAAAEVTAPASNANTPPAPSPAARANFGTSGAPFPVTVREKATADLSGDRQMLSAPSRARVA